MDSAAHVTFKVAEAAWNAVAGDDVHVICCTSYPLPIKALAVLDLAITVVPGADAAKLLEVGVKGAAKAGGEQAAFALVRWIAGKTDGKVAADLSDNVLRDAFRARETGGSSALRDAERTACEFCFPARTLVATPHGGQAIESLHVGDTILSENPTTGKVEAEPVQAVIQDPSSPLIAVDLSDGSAITVTADHPFWVDAGAQLAGAGWFAAGRLQAGDELRTAAGTYVMVVGLRRNVGYAVVYTLAVAHDHTYFVGSAQVLVHNTNKDCLDVVKKIMQDAKGGVIRRAGNYHGRLPENVEQEILSNPARVYRSTSRSGRLIFADSEGNVVVTEGTGSARGNILTSYGPKGPRGESGAATLGGNASEPGEPVTHDMIVNGQVPAPGGYLAPAVQIYP